MATFASSLRLEFGFSAYRSYSSLSSRIATANYTGGTALVAEALSELAAALTSGVTGRRNVPLEVVVISSGHNQDTLTAVKAAVAQLQGTLYFIGIGDANMNLALSAALTSSDKSIIFNSASGMNASVLHVAQSLTCNLFTTTTPTTTVPTTTHTSTSKHSTITTRSTTSTTHKTVSSTSTTTKLATNPTSSLPTAPSPCNTDSDIIFLVDSSSALSQDDFYSELLFVQSIVSGLDIGENSTRYLSIMMCIIVDSCLRIALFQYTDQVVMEFSLRSFFSSASLGQRIVESVRLDSQQPGNAPMLGRALDYVRSTLNIGYLTGSRGGSTSVVIFSEGEFGDNPDSLAYSSWLLSSIAELYFIGVGNINDTLPAANLISATGASLLVDTFADLPPLSLGLIHSLHCVQTASSTSPGVFPTTSSQQSPLASASCNGYAERGNVIFVLDASYDIGSSNWSIVKSFVYDAIESLQQSNVK